MPDHNEDLQNNHQPLPCGYQASQWYKQALAMLNNEMLAAVAGDPDADVNAMACYDEPYILVVSDTYELGAYLRICLRDHYAVCLRSNAQAALQLLAKEHRPLLIITDLVTQEHQGFRLCHALQQRDHTAGAVPLLMLTQETRPWMEDRQRVHGIDQMLVLPVFRTPLLEAVQALLPPGAPTTG